MEFDRINNSNKIIRSGKNIQKKENTPANEVRSEDKIKEFSSDYSSASRALGLSSITFKGNYEQITDARFKERKEKVKKQLEKENLYSEKAIDEILGLVTKENIKVAEIVSKQGCFKDTTIKEFLLNTTKETAKFKNEFATFFDDTIYIILIGNMLKDNDLESLIIKDRLCKEIKNSTLDDKTKLEKCRYITSYSSDEVKQVKASYDLLCNSKILPKEKIFEQIEEDKIPDYKTQKELCEYIKAHDELTEDEKIILLNLTNKNTKDFVYQILDDKIISIKFLDCILNPKDSKSNIQAKRTLYEKWKNHPSFNKEENYNFNFILQTHDKETSRTILKLLDDNIFTVKEIDDVITTNALSRFKRPLLSKEQEEAYEQLKTIDRKEIRNAYDLIKIVNETNSETINNLLKTYKTRGLVLDDIKVLINHKEVTEEELKNLRLKFGDDVYKKITINPSTHYSALKLKTLYQVNNINELNMTQKRSAVRGIISANNALFNSDKDIKSLFPLLPTSKEEYCTLLPALVKSLGIETNELTDKEIENFNSSLSNCANSLAKLSDEEFNNLTITQDFTREKFIETINEKISHLSKEEKQKVFDYYGFEIRKHPKTKTGYTIIGYPINLNNGEKLSQIENPETKKVVEALRNDVINFSENNSIKCNNKEIENELNSIAKYLPEIHSLVDKAQHETHSFDILKHSLKVLQKTVQNPAFDKLNENDKKIMLLAGLMHDTAKYESATDVHHEKESAFDAYFIAKKFKLSKEDEIKFYTLIKNHDWFKQVNKTETNNNKSTTSQIEEKMKKIAFIFQCDNLFEMAKILTEADLKGVKNNNSFFEKHNKNGNFTNACNKIQNLISELQKTRPILPTTKLPKASEIKSRITTVNPDYSTNIKGVYQDENGMIIIRYNEVENWEELGFAKGETSKGISFDENEPHTTGTIKFIAHGLDRADQVANFDAFSLPETDALLSVSYMERPESKYRLFRTQGLLLDVDARYVYGGGRTDAGSGCAKNIEKFIADYAFKDSKRHNDRIYISNLIKTTLNLNDEEYVKFLEENENKSFLEIEPKEVREKLIQEFAKIKSTIRNGGRSYNEMYISNPKIQGVFAYSETDTLGETKEFMKKERISFLKKYALENDIPFVLFGN